MNHGVTRPGTKPKKKARTERFRAKCLKEGTTQSGYRAYAAGLEWPAEVSDEWRVKKCPAQGRAKNPTEEPASELHAGTLTLVRIFEAQMAAAYLAAPMASLNRWSALVGIGRPEAIVLRGS